MNNLVIEKDKILKCFVVWEVFSNCKVERFRSKTKKECKLFIKKCIDKKRKKIYN